MRKVVQDGENEVYQTTQPEPMEDEGLEPGEISKSDKDMGSVKNDSEPEPLFGKNIADVTVTHACVW